jgi:hypothetical protein
MKRKFIVEQLEKVMRRQWPGLSPRLRWELSFRLMESAPLAMTLHDYVFSKKEKAASPEQCLALLLRYCMPPINEATNLLIDEKTKYYEYPKGCISETYVGVSRCGSGNDLDSERVYNERNKI